MKDAIAWKSANYVCEAMLALLLVAVLIHNRRGTEYKFVYIVASLMLVQTIADLIGQVLQGNQDYCDAFWRFAPALMVGSSAGTTVIWTLTNKYFTVASDLRYVLNKEPVPGDKSCCKHRLLFWLVLSFGISSAVCEVFC